MCLNIDNVMGKIQGIHKRIVQFQKLTRNLFLTLRRHNVHHQQRQLSKSPSVCVPWVARHTSTW